ncbi:hypothetical protein R3P38DRAFT_3263757 [Favolaschia claudopus]|uniref:Histone chaperone domain-containing protein n=1 Tax=Favolaschia claudopus TaxID=2862362 RepID=A0AAW0C827_9AGAR
MSLPAPPTTRRNQPNTALAAIAAIKDEQRREDIEYGGTANHPPSPARSHRQTQTPQFSPEEEEEMDSDPEADNSSGSDAFQPPDDSNDSSDDEEDPDDSEVGEEASAAIPCKNKKKIGRADIQAVRQTQDIAGTPEIGDSETMIA